MRPSRRLLCVLSALVLLAMAPPDAAPAQTPADLPPSLVRGIRILDQDRLFNDSRLGQSLLADFREAERALERDNQELADQLAEEERLLTEARATLDPETFRARADAFDRRVEIIRAERARLSQELALRYETEAQRFFETALPILTRLMAEEGVVVVLRPEVVILGADWLDMTDLAIDRLDRATVPQPAPASPAP